MTIAEKITKIAEDMPKIYEAGKKNEHDRFWDAYQEKGERTNYSYCFAGLAWNRESFTPKYDIVPKWGGSGMMFYNSTFNGSLKEHLETLGINLNLSETIVGSYIFYGATSITELPYLDLSNCQTLTCVFYNCTSLKSLNIKLSDKNEQFVQVFDGASALEHLVIDGVIAASIDFKYCPLTKASITNVIEHLSDAATEKSLTLKKSAKKAAFTDDEWEKLTATKPTWTILLV